MKNNRQKQMIQKGKDRYSDQKEYYLNHLKKQQNVKNNKYSPLGVHHKHLDEFIRTSIRVLPKGTEILDAGCGLSQWVNNKLRKKYIISGVDGEPEAIETCKILYPGQDYRIGNLYKLDYKNEMFHAVVMREVIEHFITPEKAVKEIYRILKPGGTFVLTTPNYNSLLTHFIEHTYNRFFGGPCKPYKKDVHPSKFNPYTLRKLLEKYFEVKYLSTIDFGVSQTCIAIKNER